MKNKNNHSRCLILSVVTTIVLTTACTSTDIKPISDEEIVDLIHRDKGAQYDNQAPLEDPLTLAQAMARAVKFNLEHRVKMMEEALSAENFELAKTDLLPVLAANAGYLDRSNEDASRSISVLTRQESLEPSTSQEPERTNADLALSWNLLDFGISSLQIQQDADNLIVTAKAREKVMLNLLQQVRRSYWKAVAMDQASAKLDDISLRANRMLDNLLIIRSENLRTPTAVLLDIRTLVETKNQINQIRHSMSLAKIELATLINVPITTDITLADQTGLSPLPRPSADFEKLEIVALTKSADYLTQTYEARSEQIETRKALRRLLPGLEFSYGGYHHSNSFLWNNQWGELGARLTSDITRLFYRSRIKEARLATEMLAVAKRRTTGMAVVATVHLSWQQYQNALQTLDNAVQLDEIDQEISNLTRTRQQNSSASGVKTIQDEFRAFQSSMGRLLSYAQAQGAYGTFLNSLGVNPIPAEHHTMSVGHLAEDINKRLAGSLSSLGMSSELPSKLDYMKDI